MKNPGLLLIFVASLTLAAEAPRPGPPAPGPGKNGCTDALRPQMEADNAAALQLKSTAYTEGLERGAALGAGGALLLAGLALRAWKFKPGDRSNQERMSRAASA